MPLHDFRCPMGHVTEEFVAHGVESIQCPRCGTLGLGDTRPPQRASKVFLRFPFSVVQADVHYQSPVDGRIISSKQQHLDDLARNNCVSYDPEMKDDYMRRQRDADEAIGQKVEQHFDAELSAMPVRKKELLEQELRSGADLEFTRSTA